MKLFPSIYHSASLLQMTPLFSIEPHKKVPHRAEYRDSSFQMVSSGRAVLSPLSFVLYIFFFSVSYTSQSEAQISCRVLHVPLHSFHTLRVPPRKIPLSKCEMSSPQLYIYTVETLNSKARLHVHLHYISHQEMQTSVAIFVNPDFVNLPIRSSLGIVGPPMG